MSDIVQQHSLNNEEAAAVGNLLVSKLNQLGA
jgi:hypothetical protein